MFCSCRKGLVPGLLRVACADYGACARSKSYFIAKDLAHAIDELDFYEIAKGMEGQAGWGLLDFLFEYKGVAKMQVQNKDGPAGERDLLIMRNLFDGKQKLRLLDIKIGQYTADANWKGKSAFRASKQKVVDAQTNSSVEGYRMEGFDGAPNALVTFNSNQESALMSALFSERKTTRFQFQSMPAKRFLSWFLDCRDGTMAEGYDPAARMSNAEYGESVLRVITVKMAALCKSLRQVPCPQKWLGSSIALTFDVGALPERGAAAEEQAQQADVRIFDWGRSELLSKEAFEALAKPEQEDRTHFWNLYSDAACRLFYEALRAYYHRFCTPSWEHVVLEVYDFDASSHDDLCGTCVVPLEETTVPKEFKLLDASHKPVQKKGRDCHLKVSIAKRPNAGPESAVPTAWMVTVHGADQIPNMDKKLPEWTPNLRGAKSDGYVLVTARHNNGPRTSPTEKSKCCMQTNHPAWEETFEFGLCNFSNFTSLLEKCGLGVMADEISPEQLGDWFPPERGSAVTSPSKADDAGWTSFLTYIEQAGFGSAFKSTALYYDGFDDVLPLQ